MTELTGKVGFASPVSERRISRRRVARRRIDAAVALTVCLIIAATAVSIGMARAQALADIDRHDHELFAVALFFGASMVGTGGLTAIAAGGRQTPRDELTCESYQQRNKKSIAGFDARRLHDRPPFVESALG